MDSSIINLSNKTDKATKQMLQNVVNKKRKFERYKNYHFLFLWISVFYCFITIYLMYHLILKPYSYSFYDIFSIVFNNQFHMLLLFIAVFFLGATKVLYDKKEKYEKEYHELRCEIIDRSKDLWKDEAWKTRHEIFEMMKAKYDINLYHEAK
ncbi:DUF2663 family protein [Bacillus sp. FJAT-49736]|uniref:DUF2663 family protein n=1 Tax=Bacillus sp. FJAT-49736 TaxID=2833582 RepID=UPI001BC9B7FB|nr:DUF2663 family protein [Bacillus sp. FJAT-49736]MBS4173309.1 DUF2663 family protein [Bacillus sp. FJAT-49736]